MRYPLWQKAILWLSALSLDAVLVALAWQYLFAQVFGDELALWQQALLAYMVWAVYMLDRWLDARPDSIGAEETFRHAFMEQHQRVLAAIAVILGLSLGLYSLPYLTVEMWWTAGWLGLAVIAYQGLSRRIMPAGPRLLFKRAVTAIIFSWGVSFFQWEPDTLFTQPHWVAWGTFAMLCFAQLMLIASWECRQRKVLQEWPWRWLMAFIYSTTLLASLWAELTEPALTLPLQFSLAGLVLIDMLTRRWPVEIRRTSADLVLAAAVLTYWL